MHAEHKGPLYAFCVLALAAALLVGQGLRTQAFFDYFVGDRGHGSAQFAAGSTISAATEPDDAAHGTTVVAVPERRTVVDRPASAAQPATRAPGRSHQAAGKAHASGTRGGSAKATRSGRVAVDDSQLAQRGDFRAAQGQAKAGGKSKAKAGGKKVKKSKAKKSKKSKKAKGKKAKRHARNRRHGR